MYNINDKVIVNPQDYPTSFWEGVIISKRKSKYGWMTYKVKYDCGGMFLTASFTEKEITK